jgi:hypothetical protein
MPQKYGVLGQANPVTATLVPIYTVPLLTQAVISTISVCNRSTSTLGFRLSIAVAGGVDDLKQYLAYDTPLVGKETKFFTLGITLGPGDQIRGFSHINSISFNVFGVENT